MANSQLQALFSPPRNAANPKVANTYIPQFSTGEDGKRYKMASEADRNKFHILTDAEIEEELRVSKEMASTLKTMNPKKPGKTQTQSVKLGTGSRAKKIEKRAWEKKIAAQDEADQRENNTEDSEKGPELSAEETMLKSVADMQQKYTANLSVIEKLISEKVHLEEKLKSTQRELRKSKKLNHFQASQSFKKNKNEQLVDGNATIQSVDALKNYYQQNLDLIESLYLQQKSTELKLIAFQQEFIEIKKERDQEKEKGRTMKTGSAGAAPSALSADSEAIRTHATETNNKYLRNLTIVEQLFAERKSLTTEVQTLKKQLWSLKRSSAMNEKTSEEEQLPQGGGGGARTSTSREQFHSLVANKGSLYHTAPGALQKDMLIDAQIRGNIEADVEEEENEDELPTFEDDDEYEHDGGRDRDICITDPSSGNSNVRNVMHLKRSSSPTLQKTKTTTKDPYMEKIRQSEEKYFEKKKLALERERQEALEQEMYEFELEKKRLRASKTKHQVVTINGKEKKVIVPEGMSGMAERDKLAEKRRAERAAKKLEADKAAALEQQKAVEKERKQVERLTKAILLSRQKEEAERKKAQEEKGEVESDKDIRRKDKQKDKQGEAPPKPKLSPAEISEKLRRQQELWDAKLAKEKEAKKAKMMQTTQDKSVNEMLQRQEEREQKLREKHKERELAAQAAADALVAEDLAKKEKLRRKAQLNGVAAKEQAAKAKLEETLKAEEQEKKMTLKKQKKASAEAEAAPTYKNAAEMIKALTKGKAPPAQQQKHQKTKQAGNKEKEEEGEVGKNQADKFDSNDNKLEDVKTDGDGDGNDDDDDKEGVEKDENPDSNTQEDIDE